MAQTTLINDIYGVVGSQGEITDLNIDGKNMGLVRTVTVQVRLLKKNVLTVMEAVISTQERLSKLQFQPELIMVRV